MRDDSVAFSEHVERALYDAEHGFYETGGRAGRRGDFVTSPEVGPLFGACLARALDGWWDDQGRPDPFFVDEHGAGPGTLARTVLVAAPDCASALRWTLVERSAAQRALHPAHLPHVGDLAVDGSSADARWTSSDAGPLVASAADRPTREAHVIVANELLDNLPFDLLERTGDGWAEVRIEEHAATRPLHIEPDSVAGPSSADDAVGSEVLLPALSADAAIATHLASAAVPGARIPLQHRAGDWVAASLAQLVMGGCLVVLDYATTTSDLAARPPDSWIRTYIAQARGGPPLHRPGAQDITVEVCVDQLAAAARPPDLDRDQEAALRAWGIEDLVADGRRQWVEGAGAPDLAALRARSRIAEAQVLTDPSGLGAYRVLEWRTPGTSSSGDQSDRSHRREQQRVGGAR